ncbi:MAG: hypothetical protein ACPGLV_11215 [Bacteroidia bacterium]
MKQYPLYLIELFGNPDKEFKSIAVYNKSSRTPIINAELTLNGQSNLQKKFFTMQYKSGDARRF